MRDPPQPAGRLDSCSGHSALPWSVAETQLADLIAEFGPPSRTARAQAAAYPFTRLRADGVWDIDQAVPDDNLTPLRELRAVGHLEPALEQALRERPSLVRAAARRLVESQFP
jgi:putative restriction endonuclease